MYQSQSRSEHQDAEAVHVDKSIPSTNVRSRFIGKVLCVIGVMLLYTCAWVVLPFLWNDMRIWFRANVWFAYIPTVLVIGLWFIILCFHTARHTYPLNIILVVLFTTCVGVMLAAFCASYEIISILIAVIVTTAAVFGIAIFALTIKKDLTSLYGVLFIVFLVLILFAVAIGIASFFISYKTRHILQLVLAVVFTLVYMVHLALTIQSIVGGRNRRIQFDESEWLAASIIAYMDIVQIFMGVTQIAGAAQG